MRTVESLCPSWRRAPARCSQGQSRSQLWDHSETSTWVSCVWWGGCPDLVTCSRARTAGTTSPGPAAAPPRTRTCPPSSLHLMRRRPRPRRRTPRTGRGRSLGQELLARLPVPAPLTNRTLWQISKYLSTYLSTYQSISTSCQSCLHCVFCAEYSLMFCCQALFFLPRYLFQGNEVWLPDKKEFFRRILEPFWKDAFVPWHFIKAT